MIPRHHKIIFAFLLLASLAMAVVLWELRERAHQRMLAGQDAAPTAAPEVAPAEQATLVVANDADNLPSRPGSLPPVAQRPPVPVPAPSLASSSTSTPPPTPPTPSQVAPLPSPRYSSYLSKR